MADKNKKNKRRRESQLFRDLQTIERLEDDPALVSLYQNKNYQPPPKRTFETLFEDAKRGFSEDGQLALGKALDKRYIEDYSFWKQDDKVKNKRRKGMIQKQFKGRKRLKEWFNTECIIKRIKK